MSRMKTIAASIIAAAVAVFTGRATGDFTLQWYTIDGGGGTSTGGGYTLSGTIGQPDAGTMSDGQYVLVGGYWTGAGDVDPKTPTCSGDINGDSVVDVIDLLVLLGAWGPCGNPANCPADLNGDTVVDVIDLLVLLGAWGPCE